MLSMILNYSRQVTYQVSFREQFSIAFDAYLAILRRIKSCMDVALGRDATNWRLKNSCPACHYEVCCYMRSLFPCSLSIFVAA